MTISAAILFLHAGAAAPASGWRFYKPKVFPCLVICSFIHCVPCQPLKVLVAPRLLFSGTLKGTWSVLEQSVSPEAPTSKRDLVSTFTQECCLRVLGKLS